MRSQPSPREAPCTRRELLAAASGFGLALSGLPALASERSRLSPEEFKARLRGPILSIPTPFTADFGVDYQGVRNMIHLGLAHGVQVYELTAGNSRYDVLSEDEIKKLTRVVVETVNGRGIVIAATGAWWTGRAVDHARFAASVGADALQVLLPPGSDDGYVEHFRKIAASTPLALVLQGELPPALMERLIAIPAIVAMKEDGSDQYYVDIVRRFGKRLAIFCGGQTRRYLLAQPYGSPAFFSTLSTFAPEIDRRFWQAIERGDSATASAISAQVEQPLIAFCLAGPRSFHAYWRALLEHFGVAHRFVRPPEASCTEEDMRQVAALCDRIGLKPEQN